MKINSKSLYSAIDGVAGLISARNPNPASTNLLVKAQGKKLTLTAVGLDDRAMEVVEAETEGDFAACVDPDRLKASVAFAKETVSISSDDKALIIDNGANCRLPFIEADEFPADVDEKLEQKNISCFELANGISSVAFAALKSNARPIINSVHVKQYKGKALCEGTDGMNGAYYMFGNPQAVQLLIPLEATKRVIASLQREGSALFMNDRIVKIAYKNGYYWCKQIEGRYPDTDMIRDSEDYKPNKPLGKINGKELHNTLQLAVIMSGIKEPMVPIDVEFSGSGMLINGANFKRNIEGRFSDFKTRLNARSVAECSAAFSGEVELATGKQKFIHLSAGNLSVFSMPLREV